MVTTVKDTTSIIENTPVCLKERRQWVVWRCECPPGGKPTKVPYNARTGQPASSIDRATWTTFERAVRAYSGAGSYDGVGYVFSADDPFCGIDLDDCIGADGSLAPWAQGIVECFDTYTEISPSERGVKLFFRASKPAFAGCKIRDMGAGAGNLEVYDKARYFTVTGNTWPGAPLEVGDRQPQLNALCDHFWRPPQAAPAVADPPTATLSQSQANPAGDCLADMLSVKLQDKTDGSMRLFTAACRCVEHDLPDAQALATIRAYAQVRPFPTDWTDEQIVQRIRDAEKKCRRGSALSRETFTPAFKSVGQLLTDFPEMRRPVLYGLLREGETMNIIAPPKTGKSWLVTDLALSVATGRRWLGTYRTEKGQVLILDNELHGETSANRIPKVAAARGISLSEIAESVYVENLRGRLRDLLNLGPYFRAIEPGRFKLVILDAFYRFIPKDTDENDNGSIAQMYNHLDRYACELGCCFVLIHHATKGSQSAKAVTDVGAGAGSQSRATDTHLILRPHEEDGAVVLDAAVRSWQPIEPMCLRWSFPTWTPAPDLDPTALRPDRPRRTRAAQPQTPSAPAAPEWDTSRFVSTFIAKEPRTRAAILEEAEKAGLSERRAEKLLKRASDTRQVHVWKFASNRPVKYSTEPQPLLDVPAPDAGKRGRK